MSAAFIFGRFCGRRGPSILLRAIPRRQQCFSQWTRKHSLKDPRQRFNRPRALLLLAPLSPAAFVQISEEVTKDGQTAEAHMLEISREEIRKKIPDDVHGLKCCFRSIVYVLDQYVYEPIATSLRFFHLVVIFVPLIVTIPMIWFGRRRKDRDNERTGTLWWYGFLVASMERAGPAFIKVIDLPSHLRTPTDSMFPARTMGSVQDRHFSYGDVQCHV